MKKRINWLKIVLLILTIIELIIVFMMDKELIQESLNAWRLYTCCVLFIVMNTMFICIKKGGK